MAQMNQKSKTMLKFIEKHAPNTSEAFIKILGERFYRKHLSYEASGEE